MKVKFTATTKRTAMPKGITLKIEGQASVPKGMSRADLIQQLKEYASSEMLVSSKYHLTPGNINIALG